MFFRKQWFQLVVSLTALVFLWNAPGHSVYAEEVSRQVLVEHAASFDQFCQKTAKLVKNQDRYISTSRCKGKYASGRLIVSCDEGLIPANYDGLCHMIADQEGHYILQFDSEIRAEEALEGLKKESGVEYVEPDVLLKAYGCVQDGDQDSENLSWGPEYLGTDSFSDYVAYKSDKSLVVGVVDSGVQLDHPYLKNHLVAGYDFVEDDNKPNDQDGHGSHVAGIIVDNVGDVDIQIMPVRTLDEKGEGYASDIGNGIRYAVDHGASVLNLSVGGDHVRYLDESIEYALDHDVICVVASGNENARIGNSACPAHRDDVIAVGAIDRQGRRCSFSNYGSQLDYVAPGQEIYSSVLKSSYENYNGTSMATPMITACVAMLKVLYPDYDQEAIEEILMEISSRGDDPDDYYGYGCPDMAKLVDEEVPCRHKLVYEKKKAATCKLAGRKACYSCSRCKCLFQDKDGQIPVQEADLKIGKIPHDYSSQSVIKKAGLNKKGKALLVCSMCNRESGEEIILPAVTKVELKKTNYTYSGESCKPQVLITLKGGNQLDKSEYKVSYQKNLNAGTAIAKVRLRNAYEGSFDLEYTIKRVSMTKVTLEQSEYYYKGNWPQVILSYKAYELEKGTDYSVVSQSLTKDKKVELILKGKGNFKGSETFTYKLKLKTPTITCIRLKKTSLVLMWKKNEKCYDGYEIQYAYNSKYEKGKKLKLGKSKESTSIEDLKKDKKLYLRIRGYKSFDGEKLYSPWSQNQLIEL